MNHVPDIEFATPEQIIKFQSEKLMELLKYVTARSPFYKKQFASYIGLMSSIKGPCDLIKLPVTTKNDLQIYNDDFLCLDKSKIAEFTITSGTLGKPVTIALSRNDVERLAYNEAISFACAGGNSGDLYQLALTMDRQFMAGLAYYEGIRKLGAGLIRTGPGFPTMQWEAITRYKPTAIVSVPSFIVKLLEFAKEQKIDFNKTLVKKIICIGESIRNVNLQPNILAKRITEQWNVHLYSTYASTEMQTAFTECEHGMGGHLHPELLILEILDENNEPVKDGDPGEICVTTLGVEAMPLIRYKTGDIANAYTGKCPCGRSTTRLGPILGRKQQMLKLKGTTIYPPAIFEILNKQQEIQDYVVEALTGDLGTDQLKIYLKSESKEGVSITSLLTREFQSILRVLPEIVFVNPHEFANLTGAQQNRKALKFIDSRIVSSKSYN